MTYILHIHTALEEAFVSLSVNGTLLAEKTNPSQKEHAAFLQPAIKSLLAEQDISFARLSAVSVIIGPGSYTGLRVGMSGAKGLCFALSIPLITFNTLEWMAAAAADQEAELICPMIDARRNEVFTALYQRDGQVFMQPTSMILEPASFSRWLNNRRILFFGNGALKFAAMTINPNALFYPVSIPAGLIARLAWEKFNRSDFADLAYTEPFYGKDFYSPARRI